MRVLSKSGGRGGCPDDVFSVHDVGATWDGLMLPGMGNGPGQHIGVYADRSLLRRGAAVVPEGPVDDYIRWLWSVGIGSEDVFFLPGISPVRDMLSNPGLLNLMLGQRRQLEFFDVSEETERLRSRLPPDVSVHNPSLRLARQFGDKAWLRRQSAQIGWGDWFPKHRFSALDTDSVLRAMDEVAEAEPQLDFLVLKIPCSASGDGMVRIDLRSATRRTEVQTYLSRPEVRSSREIIVEAGFEHVPMSILWQISVDGQVHRVSHSQQLIRNGFEHEGNLLSSGELPDVTSDDVAQMEQVSWVILGWLIARGYVGTVGFDFLHLLSTGKVKLIEANPRLTAQAYAATVGEQVSSRRNGWAVAMSNVSVGPSVRDFSGVQDRLNGQMFDGVGGVLPFNPRCLIYEEPRCSVCCVAGDVEGAQSILDEAQASLR